jgi:hypothetical protein
MQPVQPDDNNFNIRENLFNKNSKNNFYGGPNNANNFHNELLRNKKRFSYDSVKNPYRPIQLQMMPGQTNNFINNSNNVNLFNKGIIQNNNISLVNMQMKMQANINNNINNVNNVNNVNSINPINSLNNSPQWKTNSINLNNLNNVNNLHPHPLQQQPFFNNTLLPSTNQVKVPRKVYSAGVNQNLVSNIISDNFNEDAEEEFDTFMEKIGNSLIPFIKTQKGSRYMQKFLNKLQPEKINKLLYGLSKDFREVMVDNYGNYFMQKLTQCCSSNQRMFVLQSVSKKFEFKK